MCLCTNLRDHLRPQRFVIGRLISPILGDTRNQSVITCTCDARSVAGVRTRVLRAHVRVL